MHPEPATSPTEGQPEAANNAAPVAADAAEIDDLQHRLSICEGRATRAAADLENLQKRFARELARGQAAERRRALGAWIASVDDLDRAVMHDDAGESGADRATVDGVRAVVANAVAEISRLGYPRFGSEGDVFDAGIHEVISTIPAADRAPANTVVAVIKPGYGTLEDLLRPASVVVAKDAD